MVMRRTICGLIGALSAFSGASAYGKIFDLVYGKWKERICRRFLVPLPFITLIEAI